MNENSRKTSGFMALMSRMKLINRWGLMRNTLRENISEHSLETAMLAHLLAVLRNTRFGGNVNPERAALLAVYHDATEIITGDMPTPVKYHSASIRSAYAEVEDRAAMSLLAQLPEDLRPAYESLLSPSPEETELHRLVKAADKLSAYIKCIEESQMGNEDFRSAEQATLQAVKAMELPEVDCFLEEFLPAYRQTLDEQTKK